MSDDAQLYSVVIDGVEYTPANRTTMRIRDKAGTIVASIKITGTWSAHAGTNCPNCDDYVIDADVSTTLQGFRDACITMGPDANP